MKNLIIILAAATMMCSCVTKRQYGLLEGSYAASQRELQELRENYQRAQTELSVCRANVTNLEQRLADALQTNENLQRSLAAALENTASGSANIARLVDEIQVSNRYIKELTDAKHRSDSLNVALTNRLTRSLSREELRDVDVQVLKGVVYISLNDNMLYQSGRWELNPMASQTLEKIAKIISDYSDYDVLVEGNTDNVPISTTNIRNNWDLSCLRAASVVMELQTKYNIDPRRLTAGGRGEYNPVQPNDTPVGRERNRRTQIIITPNLDQFLELIDVAPATPAAE